MAKSDKFYFDTLIGAADASYNAANYLVECLTNFENSDIQTMLNNMHEYEHAGDIKKHEITAALARAFVTPVDREDIEVISQNIDEVTDSIEEVLQYIYINHIKSISPYALEFANKLVNCCTVMKDMMTEFINFKKPQKLHELIVDLNHLEEECDWLFLKAALSIKDDFHDVLDIIAWKEVYEKMEKCADACEHVSDCVSMVVMKNT